MQTTSKQLLLLNGLILVQLFSTLLEHSKRFVSANGGYFEESKLIVHFGL